MKDRIYVIATRRGVLRMTKRTPDLSRDEIGVAITVNIPDSAFRSPIISTALDVPEDRVAQPVVDLVVDAAPQEE